MKSGLRGGDGQNSLSSFVLFLALVLFSLREYFSLLIVFYLLAAFGTVAHALHFLDFSMLFYLL